MRRVLAVLGGLISAAVAGAASCGDGAAPSQVTDASIDVRAARDANGSVAPGSDAQVDADVPLIDTCGDAGVLPNAWVGDSHLCLSVFADAIGPARQLARAPNGELFVESGGHIIATFDSDKDGVIGQSERSVFADAPIDGSQLNHGLAFDPSGTFVYASGATTVYRWPYKDGDHVATAGAQVVVHDIPNGGHLTRTLVFDGAGRLYVSVGSASDVDQTWDTRSMVRRFTIPSPLPAGGVAYASGEVYASGLRNEVGLAFDSKGRLWGVENGSDGTYMPDVSKDNPAEELNRLDAPGPRFFGYPRCWTELRLEGGLGPGTQWAYLTPGSPGDAWCRDPANVQRPAWSMQAHWAPLGVTEYDGASFPWRGDLILTAHGSSYRTPPVGRLVARVHLSGDTVVSVTPIVGTLAPDGGLQEGVSNLFRPVDVRTGLDGALYFSDDGALRIYRIGYRP